MCHNAGIGAFLSKLLAHLLHIIRSYRHRENICAWELSTCSNLGMQELKDSWLYITGFFTLENRLQTTRNPDRWNQGSDETAVSNYSTSIDAV